MAWPDNALTDGETIIMAFRPHWKLLFLPVLWGVGALGAFGLLTYLFGFNVTSWFQAAAVVFVLIWFVIRPFIGWWFTRYVLTSERLITRTGLIAQRGIEIPLENITNVNFSQSLVERAIGAGDLVVESAGEGGQSDFMDIPHPDSFQAVLYKTREARTMGLSAGGRTKSPAQDGSESIRKLAALRDDGLISEAEYEQKRKDILDRM